MQKNEVKILIADDEEIIRKGLIKLLNNKGYTDIIEADNGQKVLSLLSNIDFHIFILDIKLPGMDGIKLLKEIKKIKENAKIIIITGHGNIENCREAFLYGAVDFLTKPFAIEQLYASLEKIIKELNLKSDIEKFEEKNIADEILKLINISCDEKIDKILREDAILRLGKIKDKRVIPVLLNLLNTKDSSLKEKIIYTLGRIGDPVIYEELIQILKNEKEKTDVRMAAVMALNFLGKKEITAPLIKAIQEKIAVKKRKKDDKKPIKKSEIKITNNIKIEIDAELAVIYFYNIISREDITELENYLEKDKTKELLQKVVNLSINLYYTYSAEPRIINLLKKLHQNFENIVIYITKKSTPINELIVRYEKEFKLNYL